MSSLLRAKRALEKTTEPIRFERGEWAGSHRATMGESHPIRASVFDGLAGVITGTGRNHVEAIADLAETLRVRRRAEDDS